MLHVYIAGALIKLLKYYNINPSFNVFHYLPMNILYYLFFIVTIIFVTQIIVNILERNKFIKRYMLLMK